MWRSQIAACVRLFWCLSSLVALFVVGANAQVPRVSYWLQVANEGSETGCGSPRTCALLKNGRGAG